MPRAIIDPRLPEECIKNLKDSGFETIAAPLTELVETPLSGHPDIQMFIHGGNLFVHPDIEWSFIEKVERYINVIICTEHLDRKYPADTAYNIASAGAFAIHRRRSTASEILEYFEINNIAVINTEQGYSKCSTMIVDSSSIITADRSIQKAASDAGLDTLLITPGYIDLPGYSYGFIGGASGRYLDTVYVTGTIEHHPDSGRIRQFIESKNMKLNILSGERILDAGTIFFID